MLQIKLGIIGLGDMGTKYAKLILTNPLGFQIVALTRIKPERLSILRPYFEVEPAIFTSDSALFTAFDNKEIALDAILVVTPHYSHPRIIEEGLKRNLYVLCDKPAAVNLASLRPLFKYDLTRLGFIFQQRLYASHQMVKDLIKSQKYGSIKRFSYIVTDWYRPNSYYHKDAWRASYKTDGGGTIINQCPHNLDFLCDLFDLPSSVRSFNHYGRYHDIEVEDESTSYLEWPSRMNGVFIASTGETPGVNRLEISLSKAKIILTKNNLEITENEFFEEEYRKQAQPLKITSQVTNKVLTDDSTAAYLGFLANFAAAITKGAKLYVNLASALKSLYLSNAIYLSAFKDETIHLAFYDTPLEQAFEEEFSLELDKKIKEH